MPRESLLLYFFLFIEDVPQNLNVRHGIHDDTAQHHNIMPRKIFGL
jgi:hypothetical protein